MKHWTRHNLLDLSDLSKEEILAIMETAKSFKEVSSREVKKVPALRGKTVVFLFFEDSTRTRASFELAAKRLSADTINIVAKTSSVNKGETILDTARNIVAMNVDLLIVRHGASGVPHKLAEHLKAAVINAGDGCRAHPTQALLDIFTMQERLGDLAGKKVAIVGDILHSRVARSNMEGLKTLGAEVTVCGPSTLIPRGVEEMGVKVSYDLDKIIPHQDVLMMLRLQLERQQESFIPSLREYARQFGLNHNRLSQAKRDVLIMHPGPTNRGLEISGEVADGEYSMILGQVTNGVAVRMAILYLLLGTKEK